ncbi:helix-turn-helix domain-containing protein [Thermoproteus tenax]|uniref:Response regulator, luxR family n=1 Tax=Thermoproteus tenax (strain ATCC 35583 / DSM 2078 / JCM 9277 / NBRC 100435 / Kra 1) TaxID=768679 RepID=G4RL21_THETK|nr:helix-turn-helix domain-containing protein [Thermoproteus tenax]CCC82266.1 response regulator, luxR family [Thermoproteus tenax Kra 1]
MKLTATEQRIVQLYSEGLKPREIANRLGISINTVYKALSKHRRISELAQGISEEAQIPQGDAYYAVVTPIYSVSALYSYIPAPSLQYIDEIKSLIKRLEDILEKLEKLDVNAATQLYSKSPELHRNATDKVTDNAMAADGPDFLRQNVWVRLLRGRVG